MVFDLLVIGGGVNGCAIARDAAGRGLSVALAEMGDLASATSSASTKLIHGGLRYLEHFEFRLVREALAEREVMLRAAPHLVRPMTFVLPHEAGLRPAWMIRAGLFLYDHLAQRGLLDGSRRVALRGTAFGAPLRPEYETGFTYADCRVDDARLVVAYALAALELGADIRVRTKVLDARRETDRWVARLADKESETEVEARVIVNAAGPHVSQVLHDGLGITSRKHVRLVKGSHIVTRRLFDGDHAYILQNSDRRVIFAIPYEQDFTLVGTTDVTYEGAPGPAAIDAAEISYLLAAINRCFARQIEEADIVWSYSGLRPLFDDGALEASVVTRDYAFDLDFSGAPALSVFGGKITTARRLAEHALDELRPAFPKLAPAWTERATLPGGDFDAADFAGFLAGFRRDWPFLEEGLALRLARAYGTRAALFLRDARKMEDLGRDFGCGLTQAELAHLVTEEWARSAEDVLWRRTKLGLHLRERERVEVELMLAAHLGNK